MVLGVTIYCTVFSLAYAWALVWILERKEKKYGQGGTSYTDAFLSAAFVLIFVFFSNVVALMSRAGSAFLYDLTLLILLAVFGTYREVSYKAVARKNEQRLRAEACLPARHITAGEKN